jgi:hypothetical protein
MLKTFSLADLDHVEADFGILQGLRDLECLRSTRQVRALYSRQLRGDRIEVCLTWVRLAVSSPSERQRMRLTVGAVVSHGRVIRKLRDRHLVQPTLAQERKDVNRLLGVCRPMRPARDTLPQGHRTVLSRLWHARHPRGSVWQHIGWSLFYADECARRQPPREHSNERQERQERKR